MHILDHDLAVVVKTNGTILVGRCTTHFSLFQRGLGCSLGVRAFDPWPLMCSTCACLHALVSPSYAATHNPSQPVEDSQHTRLCLVPPHEQSQNTAVTMNKKFCLRWQSLVWTASGGESPWKSQKHCDRPCPSSKE